MNGQNQRVLDYLAEHVGITALEAEHDLGIMRLASRIHDLKSAGYNITSVWLTSPNRYGEMTRFKQYRLEEKEQINE